MCRKRQSAEACRNAASLAEAPSSTLTCPSAKAVWKVRWIAPSSALKPGSRSKCSRSPPRAATAVRKERLVLAGGGGTAGASDDVGAPAVDGSADWPGRPEVQQPRCLARAHY